MDGYSKDELRGVIGLESYQHLIKEGLSPSHSSAVACKTTNEILEGDLKPLEGFAIGGVMSYDADSVLSKVKTVSDGVKESTDEPPAKSIVTEIQSHALRGRRRHMEDRHVILEDFNAFTGLEGNDRVYVGVYDGHGGDEASDFCKYQLHTYIAEAIGQTPDDVLSAMKQGFEKTDDMFKLKAERESITGGSTACVLIIEQDCLYIGWVGDSQAFMCKNGEAQQLMDPHKPEREDEKKRIEDAGGVVVWYGAWRVNGSLAVARAIGDVKLKKFIPGTPDTARHERDENCEFLVIACDGLWDVMNMEEVITFVKEHEESTGSREGVAEALAKHCITVLNSGDNLTVTLVFFK